MTITLTQPAINSTAWGPALNTNLQTIQDALNNGSGPPGQVIAYAGAAAPTGWLLCDGAAVSRTTYAALFAVIGGTYGAGDGSSTFNVPDLRSRVGVGAGQGPGLSNRPLGTVGGEENHLLTIAEMPAHNHGMNLGVTTVSYGGGGVPDRFVRTDNVTSANTGGGGAHNVMQPFLALNHLIKT